MQEDIHAIIMGMKLLILGASSYLGARLYKDLKQNHEVVGTFSTHQLSESFIHLDITNSTEVMHVVSQVLPDVIIHVANNASPAWCEAHSAEAIRVNQTSMDYIINAAKTISASIVYISSFSAVDMTTVYGRTKHKSESVLIQSGVPYLIIRPSLILGVSPNSTSERSFNKMLRQLESEKNVEYDTSWKFQPTYIGHISAVIQRSIELAIWGSTIPVGTPNLKSRFDVAKDILGAFGITVLVHDSDDHGVVLIEDLTKLRRLRLPEYQYNDMIRLIIEEIKNRKEFVL